MADDWTIPALKEHFDSLRQADKEAVALALTAQEKAVNAALAAADKATSKAEAAATMRFEAGNEIRGAMSDAQKSFASTDLAAAQGARLDKIEAELTERRGKAAGAGQLVGYIVGAGGLLIALATVVVPMLAK